MAQKDVGNKIPIYKLKTTNEVMDYYDEWGYEPTIEYLRQLNTSGDIPLMTIFKIQDIVTNIYLTPTPRALTRHFNNRRN